jgi:hypothetical protein
MLRAYQLAHDIEQVPIQEIRQLPDNCDPEQLWEQLISAGHISNRHPIDLASYMAFPEGTKRCAKEQPGAFYFVVARCYHSRRYPFQGMPMPLTRRLCESQQMCISTLDDLLETNGG